MRSGYLDTKYINMNEDILMSWNMLLCCMITPLVILFVGCVKSKCSNRISKYSQKNVKQWLFIYDILLAKIFYGSFFITPFQQSKKNYVYEERQFQLNEIIYSKQNTTCLLFIEHAFRLCIVQQFNGCYAVKCAYRWCKK